MSINSIGFRNLLLLLLTVVTLSCSDYTNKSSSGALGKLQTPEEQMLLSIGLNVIARNVESFSTQANLLNDSIQTYCEEQNPSSLIAAQNHWEKTMEAYHTLDAASVGPITDDQNAANIYSWPSLNTCGVDLEVAQLATTGVSGKNLTANRKGLGVLEYLLFNPDFSSRCNIIANPQVQVWLDRSVEQKKSDRCQFAQILAREISAKAGSLNRAWAQSEGNFTQSLVDGTRYTTASSAIGDLTKSLLALDKLKDLRLGAPIGLNTLACLSQEQKCPDLVEHPWAQNGLPAIVAQLKGFRAVFLGGDRAGDFGYDDYMIQKGLTEVVLDLKNRLDEAIAYAEALAAKGTLQEQVAAMIPARCSATTETTNLEPLCGLYLQIEHITTIFKTDVLTMLSININVLTPGDAD